MAKMTIAFGVLLVAISLGFWLALGRTDMAALHPAGVGLILLVSGLLANTENAKRRMLWMHIAVTFGLIGFLITLVGVVRMSLNGTASALPVVFAERAIVTLVCLVFVAACVRSFISARRARTAA
jgi:hypothetical protein